MALPEISAEEATETEGARSGIAEAMSSSAISNFSLATFAAFAMAESTSHRGVAGVT